MIRYLEWVLPLKLRTFLLTAIFLSLGLFQVSAGETTQIPKLEFGLDSEQLPEDFATFPELETWAIYQSFELDPDSGWIQDSICRMVPETGLRFLLEKNANKTKSTVFLYLDMVQFRPLAKGKFKPKKLTIFVNGRAKLSLFSEPSKPFPNPVEIPLEPSEYPDGKIYVELVPSQNTRGRFWGVWDTYLLENREKEN